MSRHVDVPHGVRLVIDGVEHPATLVREPDTASGCQRWTAYGPAHQAIRPDAFELRMGVLPGRCEIAVSTYIDAGVVRLAAQPTAAAADDPAGPGGNVP